MPRPRLHLLAVLSLDGRLLVNRADTAFVVDHLAPERTTPILTNLHAWKSVDHGRINFRSTPKILDALPNSSFWLLGDDLLHQALFAKNLVTDLHLFWKSAFASSSAPHLTQPFSLPTQYRLNFQLKRWQPTSDGVVANYTFKT